MAAKPQDTFQKKQKKIRQIMILHVFKSKIYSGAENVACQIIKGLEGQEECIYMAPHGPIEDKLKSIGLYDNYRGVDKLDISSIKAALKELKPDIIHAHDFTAGVLCAIACCGRVPIVSHLHQNPPWLQSMNLKSLSYLWASRYFTSILTVSDSVKNEYKFSDKIYCPITVLGNPFSVNGVINSVDDSGEKSDVLFVGRLAEPKNPLFAVMVAEKLALNKKLKDELGRVPIVRLVGDGELLEECESYISEHNITNVILDGFQQNPYSYMAKTKVALIPSLWEGFGLVALEEMALGIPVVCSGVGGLSEIVTEECGYQVDNIDSYVYSISTLLTDKELYKSKSEAAKKRASEYDNISEYCQKIMAIYQNLKN